ncbi:MAG TPA: GAF domain-containing protein [Acidimicrobiia bacterium]|nr:GAF domain-containing protein [Acidimicrobiia bacterium]
MDDAEEAATGWAIWEDALGALLAPTGTTELLQLISSTAVAIFEAGACSIALLDPGSEELQFTVASGAGETEIVGRRLPAGVGIAGWVLTSGQAVQIEDVSGDRRFAADVAEATGYVPRTILAAPLTTERDVVGVIEVLDPGGRVGDEMELLGRFARMAALTLAPAQAVHRLVSKNTSRAQEVSSATERLVAAVGSLADLGEDTIETGADLLSDFVAYARRSL